MINSSFENPGIAEIGLTYLKSFQIWSWAGILHNIIVAIGHCIQNQCTTTDLTLSRGCFELTLLSFGSQTTKGTVSFALNEFIIQNFCNKYFQIFG